MKVTLNQSNDLFAGFAIDKSGSMEEVRNDVIGGFNTWRSDQLAEAGNTYISVTMFDTVITELHPGTALSDVPQLTHEVYAPGGNTALFDGIARTITNMETWLAANPGFNGKVLLIIQTDGRENASQEFRDKAKVAQMIKDKQDAGWAVAFMGADMDAFTQYGDLGLRQGSTLSYASSNTKGTFGSRLSSSTSYYRGASANAAGGVAADFFAAPKAKTVSSEDSASE